MALLNAVKTGVVDPIAKVGASAATAVGLGGITKLGGSMTAALNLGTLAGPLFAGVAAAFTVFTSVRDIMNGVKDVDQNELADELGSLAESLRRESEQCFFKFLCVKL